MPTQDLGRFEFDCGRTLDDLTVAYETYGTFTGDNAVLVCHALTGSQHVTSADDQRESAERASGESRETSAAENSGDGEHSQGRGWWHDVVGPGKAIDTTQYFVVCANVPGSCYGTDGPPSESPDGKPWGTDFPAVTVGDWTRAQRQLLDELGVDDLHAVLGGSVGGMNALDWARRLPDDVSRVAAIAASPRLDAQCLGLNAVARRSIRSDPNWNEGDYYDGNHPDQGLALARQLGHLMYLSKDSMDAKFGRRTAGREAEDDAFPTDAAAAFFPYRDVESYLDYQASKFTDRFDANSYLYLTRAMDNYDLSEGYDSDAAAVGAFTGEALVLSFTSDWHFTVDQSEELAEAFREREIPVSHHVVDSDHGHDAFLVEPESVGPPIRDFLTDGVVGSAVTDTVERDETPRANYAPVHNSLFSG